MTRAYLLHSIKCFYLHHYHSFPFIHLMLIPSYVFANDAKFAMFEFCWLDAAVVLLPPMPQLCKVEEEQYFHLCCGGANV